MRALRWPFKEGDWILYLMAVVVVVFSIAQSIAKGQDISIHKAEASPSIVSQPKDGEDFSIHAMEALPPISESGEVEFSVHNAKPLPKPQGDAPKCSPVRVANRVLLIVDRAGQKVQKQVKICEGKTCRWEMRTFDVEHAPSVTILKELAKLEKQGIGWETGGENSHFLVVDFADPRNAEMMKELQVSRQDLPLLVKETEDATRKRAAGMKDADLGQWYLQQYTPSPAKDEGSAKLPAVPAVGGFLSGPNWDYNGQGSLRQHLMDPRGPHHLPAAVVNSWSEQQVQAWHNWHHEVLQGHSTRPSPATVKPSVTVRPQVSRSTAPIHNVSFGYSQGSFQSEVASYALQVAQQTARAPPARMSFSSDPKKAAKEEKKWKEKERERVRKEVRRKVWSRYATFDPFTWLTIIQIIIQVLNFLFSHQGLN